MGAFFGGAFLAPEDLVWGDALVETFLAAGLATLGEATFFLAAVFVAVAFFTAGLLAVLLAAGFATFDFGVAAFADLVEGAFFFAVME